jgi:hypothetical protein
MQKFRYNFLFVIGLVLMFGTASIVTAQNRRPKNMGILSVKTSPESYPVRIDGEVLGMSGTDEGAEFYVTPGRHLVEVQGPNDKTFSREIEFVKNRKNCICVKVVTGTTVRECPYNIVVEVSTDVTEGTPVTFSSKNIGADPSIPVNYRWSVTNGEILSGQGTPTITVSTTGLGGKTIRANLDVTDDIPGSTCFQKNEAETDVPPPVKIAEAYVCDAFVPTSRDDNKARFDNCVLRVNAEPNSQLYLIFYQGTGKRSQTVKKLKQQTLDYFIKDRSIDPSKLIVTEGGSRPDTMVEIWVVPPGAQPPMLR